MEPQPAPWGRLAARAAGLYHHGLQPRPAATVYCQSAGRPIAKLTHICALYRLPSRSGPRRFSSRRAASIFIFHPSLSTEPNRLTPRVLHVYNGGDALALRYQRGDAAVLVFGPWEVARSALAQPGSNLDREDRISRFRTVAATAQPRNSSDFFATVLVQSIGRRSVRFDSDVSGTGLRIAAFAARNPAERAYGWGSFRSTP